MQLYTVGSGLRSVVKSSSGATRGGRGVCGRMRSGFAACRSSPPRTVQEVEAWPPKCDIGPGRLRHSSPWRRERRGAAAWSPPRATRSAPMAWALRARQQPRTSCPDDARAGELAGRAVRRSSGTCAPHTPNAPAEPTRRLSFAAQPTLLLLDEMIAAQCFLGRRAARRGGLVATRVCGSELRGRAER